VAEFQRGRVSAHFILGLCRRLIDYLAPEGLLVVAMPRLFLLCLMNTTVRIAVVMATNVAGPVTQFPWILPQTASCRSLMCGELRPQNVRTLTRDAALATVTEAHWMISHRCLPAAMDIPHKIPLTHLAPPYTATLHARCHLPTHTPSRHPHAHTHRLHVNLLLRHPPYRRSLQAS
jgi:hypothetical protein